MLFIVNVLCGALFNSKGFTRLNKDISRSQRYISESTNISQLITDRLYGKKSYKKLRINYDLKNKHEKIINDIIKIFHLKNASKLIPLFLAISKVGTNQIECIERSWKEHKESFGIIPISSPENLKILGSQYETNPSQLNTLYDYNILSVQITFFIEQLCENNMDITYENLIKNMRIPENWAGHLRENAYKFYSENIKGYRQNEHLTFNNEFSKNYRECDFYNTFLRMFEMENLTPSNKILMKMTHDLYTFSKNSTERISDNDFVSIVSEMKGIVKKMKLSK